MLKRRIGFTISILAIIIISIFGINIANAANGTAEWNFYSTGGHLVINGTNTEYGSPTRSGTFDINTRWAEGMAALNPPWYSYCKDSIETVEFATSTAPTCMNRWFYGCKQLKSIDSTNLDTSQVTSMTQVFQLCDSLTDISSLADWKVDNVIDMSNAFGYCSSITDFSYLSEWHVNSVTKMAGLFNRCSAVEDWSFLSNWKIDSAADISNMFGSCTNLRNLEPISDWDVSHVTNMSSLFSSCRHLTDLTPISGWDISNVTNMSSMFSSCVNLRNIEPISGWDITGVTNLSSMFNGCTYLSNFSPIAGWNVSDVVSMEGMFRDVRGLSNLEPLSNWHLDSVTNIQRMFWGCASVSNLSPIAGWTVDKVRDMESLFRGCISLEDISALSNWQTKSVTNMASMFQDCTNLSNIQIIDNWQTDSVINVSSMFSGCTSLEDISAVSKWQLQSATNMSSMLEGCTLLRIAHLDNWNPKSNVTTTKMFSGCTALETIYCRYSWTPSNNANMFDGCTLLTSETTNKTYADGYDSNMANPVTGLFTLPPALGTYAPQIQKVVLDESGNPLEDWTFVSGQFAFVISALTPEAPMPTETEVQTDETGKAIWPEISYYDPGEYIYQITEISGDIEGITYDTSPHELKVTVAGDTNSIPQTQEEFNALSWQELADLGKQCSEDGSADYEHLLGFTKDVDVEGVGVVKAKLIGLNHDTYADGGTAGFTFQLTDGMSTSLLVTKMQMNTKASTSGGWRDSLMRKTNMPALLAALPSDLRSLIKKVTKKSSTSPAGAAVVETEDDLFLLSLVESIGTTKTAYTDNPITSSRYMINEGSQYEYYKQFDSNKTEAFNHHIIKADSGSANSWWLRSIYWNYSNRFYLMNTNGDWSYYYASYSYLPAAGFCL